MADRSMVKRRRWINTVVVAAALAVGMVTGTLVPGGCMVGRMLAQERLLDMSLEELQAHRARVVLGVAASRSLTVELEAHLVDVDAEVAGRPVTPP